MNTTKEIRFTIHPEQQGQYLSIPFEMPERIGKFTLRYEYPQNRFAENEIENGRFCERRHLNTIDLGLVAPGNRQIAATGSDKKSITITESWATPGCSPTPLVAGTWQIMAGAYRVAAESVEVHYSLQFEEKEPLWLSGDLHTHTLASDGSKTAPELCLHAQSQGLDFIAITDHNQFIRAASLPQLPGFTAIPGVEWTHYRGHSNFLGLEEPYDAPFFCNDADEAIRRFRSAHERGALIVINHPHDEGVPFTYPLESLPYDCVEIWNGPMRLSNLQAIAAWQACLVQGQKQIAVCGSDYHEDHLFQILGGPSIRVYAESRSAADILDALRRGHSYFVYQAHGPKLEMQCAGAPLGSSLPWKAGLMLSLQMEGLQAGDEVRLVGKMGSQTVHQAQSAGNLRLDVPVREPGFLRLELWRSLYPGIPALPLLLSNPIWFD
ncbi:MAG: CehA/McbA family metallohydrolase [Anaerolineaceae bacterium]|nr:CehA/McbA family metallohydrolase [Anaerolineaceae bacterium]